MTKERLLGFDEIPTITDDLNVAEQDDNNVLPFESIPPIAPVFDPDEDEKEINDSLDDIMATEFDTPKVVTLRDKARKVLNLVHTGPFGTGGTKTKSEMTLADDLINAGKEMTTNLKIGGYRLLASAAANLKRRGMQFMYATGYPLYLGLSKSDKELLGIDSYEQLIRGYWEVLGKVPQDVPDPVPGISIPVSIADMPIMQSPPPLPLYERTGVPHVPGAFAGAVLDAAAKMPDAQRIYWEYKAGELGERQARFSYSQAPITRISRAVVQGGLPSYGISLGVSLLTGDYVFGLFVLGETAGGEGFQNQLDKGSGLIKAGVLGELIEAAEIGGELLVFPKVVKGFAKGIPLREFLVIVAENTGQEGVTGFAQRFLEVLGEATSKGLSIGQAAQLAIAEGVKAIPENAVVGGILAGGGAGTAITTHAVRGWITGDAVGPVAPMEVQEPTMKAQEGGKKALGVVQEPRTAVEGMVTTPQGKIAAEKPAPAADGIFHRQTGLSELDGWLKNPEYAAKQKGKKLTIMQMSPDEYFARVTELQQTTPERTQQMVDKGSFETIMQAVQSGATIDMPYIDYARKTQEGRARVAVAKALGQKQIPVLIIELATKSAPAAEKAFYKMTLAEYKKANPGEGILAITSHQAYLRQAAQEGKDIPANVLKDYPDLAKGIEQHKAIQAIRAAAPPAPVAEKAEEPKAEMKVSRLAERTAERAIAAGIEEDFGHLPEYATMNMAEQARLGIDLVKRDKPRARRIIQMREESPPGLRAGSVFMALEFEAIATKNGELSLELSKSPLAQHFSALGQEIKALDVGIEHSPVKALKKLADTLESVVKKKLGVRDLKTVREKTAKTVKAEVRERVNKTGSKRPTWEQFIKSIECA